MFSETSVFLTRGMCTPFISLITSALQMAGIISMNLARTIGYNMACRGCRCERVDKAFKEFSPQETSTPLESIITFATFFWI